MSVYISIFLNKWKKKFQMMYTGNLGTAYTRVKFDLPFHAIPNDGFLLYPESSKLYFMQA